MDELKDRRSVDRLLCSGVTALVYKKYWHNLLRYRLLKNIVSLWQVKSNVQNLSKSGTLIMSSDIYKRGDAIDIIIIAPGIKSIIIKGTVRWCTTDSLEIGQIGIQFMAFSNWKRYNSFSILKQLQGVMLLKDQAFITGYNESDRADVLE